ncbi:hypothetical protein [Carbonactinospora thermoautotrophica]|uniref:hypothetical protein n=1 Tax=Carbonactinospora thermoautotrophica TaxID=1469144 RepID=UPI000A857E51|nr:hypothetical protein [Carbonactinospora thermoautotrophica]
MVSREHLERVLTALQRSQPTQPPVLIRLVPDDAPLPRRTPARIPTQRRGGDR